MKPKKKQRPAQYRTVANDPSLVLEECLPTPEMQEQFSTGVADLEDLLPHEAPYRE